MMLLRRLHLGHPPRFFLLLGLSLLLGACSGDEEAKGKPAPAGKPPVPVSVAVATEKAVPVELRAVGEVEAKARVTVRSQVAGVIAQVHFREGQEVKAGELLFSIDPRPLQSALARAEAELERNRVEAVTARREAARFTDLLTSGFVSRDEAEAAQGRADSLQAALAASRASVEQARIALGYSAIRAPQAGRTGALLVHPGTVVRANDGPDLVSIQALAPIDVGFSIPERQLAALRRHLAAGPMELQALIAGEEQTPERGDISFLDNAVDPGTGTIRLKGTFANAEGRLWPGQFVELRIVLETLPAAVTVPTAALQIGQQGDYLYVIGEDDSVTARPVSVGIASGDDTVIAAGLQAGETVVTEGQQRLFPGARVQVQSGAAIPAQADQP
ncbi:MAG: efflux RND transporter periplasmic adaptor subunit [Trichloromonadaceae bacterium]